MLKNGVKKRGQARGYSMKKVNLVISMLLLFAAGTVVFNASSAETRKGDPSLDGVLEYVTPVYNGIADGYNNSGYCVACD